MQLRYGSDSGDVSSMSDLPESGPPGRFINTRP
jgi:hypothetical protein